MSQFFIASERYLDRQEHSAKFMALFSELLAAVRRSPPQEIQEHIKRHREMPYEKFVQTHYWWIIRNYVVALRGYQCEEKYCRDSVRLNVHHKTYEHRGEEYAHLDDLEVLCELCHHLEHIPEWERSGRITKKEATLLHAKAIQERRFADCSQSVILNYAARGLYSHELKQMPWPGQKQKAGAA